MNITEQITMDLGRKCGDDVAAAMHRTMLLADDRAGAMAIATYGAGYALGTLTGAVAAFLEHEDGPTPELMDQVWTDFLRPLALKQLPELSATPAKGERLGLPEIVHGDDCEAMLRPRADCTCVPVKRTASTEKGEGE